MIWLYAIFPVPVTFDPVGEFPFTIHLELNSYLHVDRQAAVPENNCDAISAPVPENHQAIEVHRAPHMMMLLPQLWDV